MAFARLKDYYPPSCMAGYPCISSPRFKNYVSVSANGFETVVAGWESPLYEFTLPDAIRDHATYDAVMQHWMMMRGTLHVFPFRDPLDFASVPLESPLKVPTISNMDTVIGGGDGVTKTFQLRKAYGAPLAFEYRNITLPIVNTVTVSVGGVATPCSVERKGGLITFTNAPANGTVIRAGFLFDVPVRFASDDEFEGAVRSYGVSGFADINLVEVRPC